MSTRKLSPVQQDVPCKLAAGWVLTAPVRVLVNPVLLPPRIEPPKGDGRYGHKVAVDTVRALLNAGLLSGWQSSRTADGYTLTYELTIEGSIAAAACRTDAPAPPVVPA